MLHLLLLLPLALQDDAAPEPAPPEEEPQRGLRLNTESATPGYTLFAPLRDRKTYLIDNAGEVVHEWTSDGAPGNSVYLLENGHLMRSMRAKNDVFHGGGQGGRIVELDWDGKVLWDHTFSDEDHLHHHDFEVMPNGNVLVIAWEKKTPDEAFDNGRDPQVLRNEGMWPDFVFEVKPVRPDGIEVVWEWHAWDHLVQDLDRNRANFGVVHEHPELLDVNADLGAPKMTDAEHEEELERLRKLGYVGERPRGDDRRDDRRRGGGRADWLHTNSIDYNAALDQILLSSRELSEIWIIDHSTTTAEAAGHSGGNSGRGGDLLWRWGKPENYRAPGDPLLFNQHDAQWIPSGHPGAGHVLVFNNGNRDTRRFSSVDELVLPVMEDGTYALTEGQAYGPSAPTWSYTTGSEDFYSSHISGAQRLPGGNTLICEGIRGRLFEVTPGGEIVWEYWNPYFADDLPRDEHRRGPRGGDDEGPGPRRPRDADGPDDRGGPGAARGYRRPQSPGQSEIAVFRATRYAPDYPGLSGRIENSADAPSGK